MPCAIHTPLLPKGINHRSSSSQLDKSHGCSWGITIAQHAAILCKISHAPLLPCSLQCESCNDLCSQLLKDPCLLLLEHELLNVCVCDLRSGKKKKKNVCEAGKNAWFGQREREGRRDRHTRRRGRRWWKEKAEAAGAWRSGAAACGGVHRAEERRRRRCVRAFMCRLGV